MNKPTKRKTQHNKNKLQEIVKACEILQDDSDKIKLVLDYIKQLNIQVKKQDYPWIEKEDTLKFLSAMSITPKESHPLFTIDEITLSVLFECCVDFTDTSKELRDLTESVEKVLRHLSNCSKQKIHASHIFSLMTSLKRLDSVKTRNDLGEIVVSGAISSLLDVICSIYGHFQNGGKQSDINLDDSLPGIHVRNDGTISRDLSNIPYFLREDKNFYGRKNWENDDTDAFKLILSMKSTLREKFVKERAKKEDRLKYNKILGLNYLKNTAHLFLLEVELIEENEEVIPYYYMSYYSYPVDLANLIAIWLVILKFADEHVPKRPLYANQNYGPTQTTHSKNLTQLEVITSNILSSRTTKGHVPKTKVCKKVISYHESEEEQRFTYLVMSSSFLKKVTKDEMSIIVKLVEMDSFSPYLPRILNTYRNIVEFEVLECLPNLTEKEIIDLVIHVSKALHFLHENKIIHRDIKPANIMLRSFNQHCSEQFVLIDFGLSFSYYKEGNNCFDKKTGKQVTADLGTCYFKAPEVNEERNYDEKIDIYSLGSSIIYLLGKSQKFQMSTNFKKEAEELKWQYMEFKELVLQMLDVDPTNRPSALKVTECVATIRNNQ